MHCNYGLMCVHVWGVPDTCDASYPYDVGTTHMVYAPPGNLQHTMAQPQDIICGCLVVVFRGGG